MIPVDLPIRDPKKPPVLKFPDRCVNCGKLKARTWPVKLSTGAQKRGQMIQVELLVPLCVECAKKEDKIANVTWLPFFLVGLLAFIVTFVPVLLIAPEGTTSQTLSLPYVLAATAGLIAGIMLGTLVEFGLKILFAPAYGQLLLKRPFTVASVFSDSQQIIGLSTKWSNERRNLILTFENDDLAREFIVLNPQETK